MMFTTSRYGGVALIAGLICVSSAAVAAPPVKPAASKPSTSQGNGPNNDKSNGNTAVHEAVKEGIRGRDLAEIASGREKPPRSPH
jgi:hypothetical protein